MDSDHQLSSDQCLRNAQAALQRAATATHADARAEYQQIAKLWTNLADTMKRNGLTGLPPLQRSRGAEPRP